MPLSETQANEVINKIKAHTIEERLCGIEDSQRMFKDMFVENMSLEEYAKTARIVENLYNIIREELKQGFKLMVKTTEEAIVPEKVVKTKPAKPVLPPTVERTKDGKIRPKSIGIDMPAMSVEFMAKMFKISPEEAKRRIEENKE